MPLKGLKSITQFVTNCEKVFINYKVNLIKKNFYLTSCSTLTFSKIIPN